MVILSARLTLRQAFGPRASTAMGLVLMWSSSASTVASFIIIADLVTPTFEVCNKGYNLLVTFLILTYSCTGNNTRRSNFCNIFITHCNISSLFTT